MKKVKGLRKKKKKLNLLDTTETLLPELKHSPGSSEGLTLLTLPWAILLS